MNLTQAQQQQLDTVAHRHQLKFVVLHGSYATGKEHVGSDIDIAVLGKNTIDYKQQLELYGDFANIFGDSSERELDFKTLQQVDSLFRYLVIRDGVLLYGNQTAYDEFRAYAYRDYVDSQDLRDIEKHLVKKNIQILSQLYA